MSALLLDVVTGSHMQQDIQEMTTLTMIRTALVTNTDIVALGVREMLAGLDDTSLIVTAGTAEACMDQERSQGLDVVIVDVQSLKTPRASTLKAITFMLRDAFPGVGLIGLTDWTNKSRFEFALSLGVNGFCLKSIACDELRETIRIVAQGETYIHNDYRRLIELNSSPLFDTLFGKRQLEVLNYLVKGHTNKEIASIMQLSVETVKSHTKVILKKLGAKDRGHAISLVLNEAINVLTQQNIYFNANGDSCDGTRAKRMF